MQTQNPFFDDLARMAGGAMSALSGLRAEMEAMMRQQMERFMSGADMVPREEFEVVRDMAIKARSEQDALQKRVEALEAQLAALAPKAAPVKAAAAKAPAKPKAPAKAKAAKPSAE
ncbi:MAG: accessory factor UbiK family protein [Alphaproteobacteria bacterium]|nr:accessory factor UbiK family protein [Alphaproteobacteria bacterium]